MYKLSLLAILLISLLTMPIRSEGRRQSSVTQECVQEDAAGNTYVTGNFRGRITFGEITLKTQPQSQDLFIVKYDPAGKVIWARSTGVTPGKSAYNGYFINCTAFTLDKIGNIYLAGEFENEVQFDSTRIFSQSHAAFIAKFSPEGRVIWANKLGSFLDDNWKTKLIINDIAADDAGNSYITGGFYGRISFGTDTLTSVCMSQYPYFKDIFLARINAEGKIVWVKRAGGIGQDAGESIALDGSGNIFITGELLSLSDTVEFDSIKIQKIWGDDLFIARYDTSGNILWVQKPYIISDDYGKEISADEKGNCYVAGYLRHHYALNKWSLGVLITKYNLSGETVWIKKYVTPGNESYGKSIALNASGHCMVTGEFRDTLIMDSVRIVSPKYIDAFLAEFDTSGTQISLSKGHRRRFDRINLTKACPSGNILITGYNNGRRPFLFRTFSPYTGHYIAKYNPKGQGLWRRKIRKRA